MDITQPLIAELTHEATSTRKMLERIPQDSLAWKPHEKSRALGEIASHIANIPGLFIGALDHNEFDRNTYNAPGGTVDEILATFDKNIAHALETLAALSDERMHEVWRYRYGDRVVFEIPRLAAVRAMGINHLIHHRGQLSVYLRLLNLPVPGAYGPTADEV